MAGQRMLTSDIKQRFLNSFSRRSLNVYPTDYCNYRCVFCKVRGICSSRRHRHEMNGDAFKKLIAFCKRSRIQTLRILGGEPTQHPRLVPMIEQIYREGMSVGIIFTNGIFNNDKLVNLIKLRRIAVNFHYMPPEEYTRDERKLVLQNLRFLFAGGQKDQEPLDTDMRCMSIIFYKKNQNYRYMLDAAREYKVAEISWAFAHPSLLKNNRHIRWRNIKSVLPAALDFVREAAAMGIRTPMECPVTPCIFSPQQLRFARKFIADLSFTCEPILDVFPDLSVHYCMGLPVVSYINDINTLKDIHIDQLFRSQPLRSRMRSPACGICAWWKSKQCQGYCLQYKCRAGDFRPGGILNGLEWKKEYDSKHL